MDFYWRDTMYVVSWPVGVAAGGLLLVVLGGIGFLFWSLLVRARDP